VATAVFVSGYLVAWIGYSALATSVQWGLQSRGLLSPMMEATSPALVGLALGAPLVL
jgi:predicted metal-binding membrane protein